MSDAQQLLTRLAEFRERLARVPAIAPPDPEGDGSATEVARAVLADPRTVTHALRLLSPPRVTAEPAPEPMALTLRARAVLESARELLFAERELMGDEYLAGAPESDPIALHYRETVSLTESALRLAQALPPEAESQLRACAGLESLVESVRARLNVARGALSNKHLWRGRLAGVARKLSDLHAGRVVDATWLAELAESLVNEAKSAVPMTLLDAPEGATSAERVAAHALVVAQVAARVVPHDFEWASRPQTPVLMALLMDAGMLALPPEILAKPGELTAQERRLVEAHPARSADLIRHLDPGAELVALAVAEHHERPDGTGYPAGKLADETTTLARLLSVCDQYAAMVCDRPRRIALDPRTALTEILIAAEDGRADRDFPELVLHLSMFPLGSVVELADGRAAVVVANHASRVNLRAAARPVLAVLADSAGQILARPEYLDLAAVPHGSIARALGRAERAQLLAKHYPELAG